MGRAEDIMIRSLEEEMGNFDQVTESTTSAHHSIAQTSQAIFARINPEDLNINDADSIDNYVKLGSFALKAQAASENTAVRRVNAKLRMRDSARADNVSEAVTDMLIKMQSGAFIPDHASPSLEDQAETVMQQFNLDVASKLLDEIPDSELRVNPDHLE